ncbi:MAG TPA: ArsA-related P-loop ATPase [Myxococcaceae bacterium]|nr:ArsA-related P-loop ATPase [Myxococcaceae bacterium]
MAAFLDRRLCIITGKGGVGKSTVAAALALRSARSGKKTLAVEVNTGDRLTRLLAKPPAGPSIARLEENLWAVDIRPQEALREYVLMTLKYQAVYRAVFENRVVRTFIRLLPSVQELVTLGKVFYHLREKEPDGSYRFDRIILDAPATGHAISMLSVPQVLLDTVPPGPLAQEVRIMRDLLTDPAVTACLLVSLPEEMPVNETLELNAALRDRVRAPAAATVLNGFTAPRFTEADAAALTAHPPFDALAEDHRVQAQRSEAALRRLEAETGLPVFTVPRLFTSTWARSSVMQVAEALAPLGHAPS